MTADPLAARPLVLTLRLDEATQAWFDRERSAYFPPGRTAVGAHVTLFHALPGAERSGIEDVLVGEQDRERFAVQVTEPFPLGRGVAYGLRSPELDTLHRSLQQRWSAVLTPQDRQRFRAHVTVQNKVTPEHARATLELLRSAYRPAEAVAEGLQLWRYDGGPWTLLGRYDFAADRGPRTAGEPVRG